MLLFHSELPPRPKVQPPIVSRQPSHDGSLPSTSPSRVARRLPSPTSERPPANQLCSDSASPGRQAVALYDFDGDASMGDLVFQAGETILDVHSVSAEWMSGRIGDRTGNFPMAFVHVS